MAPGVPAISLPSDDRREAALPRRAHRFTPPARHRPSPGEPRQGCSGPVAPTLEGPRRATWEARVPGATRRSRRTALGWPAAGVSMLARCRRAGRKVDHRGPSSPGRGFYCSFYCAARYGGVRAGTVEVERAAKPLQEGTIWYALVRAEGVIGNLITRRSQVQILPPPPTRKPGIPWIPGFRRFPGEVGIYRVVHRLLPSGSGSVRFSLQPYGPLRSPFDATRLAVSGESADGWAVSGGDQAVVAGPDEAVEDPQGDGGLGQECCSFGAVE